MSKLRRRDFRRAEEELGHVVNMINDHGVRLVEMRRDLERLPLVPELDRFEALLSGVRVALERIGGNVLPSFVADVHGLRDEMARFRRDMDGYSATLMDLRDWLDRLPVEAGGVGSKPKTKPKRSYNLRKKGNEENKHQVEISNLDIAPHNEEPSGIES